jgi:hydroxyethylthiazole kinase
MEISSLRQRIAAAVQAAREKNPLVPSITNNVTINLVANAQLAVGGSAAMTYLADEARALGSLGGAFYINMGTILPNYAQSIPETARALRQMKKPWVLDPVGIGAGAIRENILLTLRECPPTIVRGNASEIIALANLWGLDTGKQDDGVRGVDATDQVASARQAARSLARFLQGAVAVSGAADYITDGVQEVWSEGGSPLFTRMTGAGCSLGGVMAVYAAVTDAYTAAVTGAAIYNAAGTQAARQAGGPASFQTAFLDALYSLKPSEVAANSLKLEGAETI